MHTPSAAGHPARLDKLVATSEEGASESVRLPFS
jgi:hypothetical protein